MARLIFLTVIMVVICVMLIAWVITTRRWRVRCEEHGDRTEVWLTRGDHHHFIGAVDRMRADYTDRVLEMQSTAEDKRNELNSLRKVLNS